MAVLFGVAAVHVLAIGALSVTGGCKTQEVLKDRPYIPAPSDTPAIQPATPVAGPDVSAVPEIKTEPIKYTVKSGDSFWKIARDYGVSKEELAAYNKMPLQKPLKTGAILMIPPGGAPVSPEKLASHGKVATGKAGATHPANGSYTVGSNDSLWKIAAKYNIKTDALAAANNIDPKKPLQVGQKLVIPETGANAVAAKATAPATKVATPKTAAKGADAGIAPVESVKATAGPSEEEKLLNELEGKPSSSNSAAGMNSGASSSTTTYAEHEVSDGDTVEDIAAMYGLRTDEIRKANPGLPADGKLKAPMTLKIPEGSK
jgi:LysM repeat protein